MEKINKNLQFKNVLIETKNLAEDDKFGIIEGIANKVGHIDAYNDMTVKGAFSNTVKNKPIVLALKNHWLNKVLGTVELSEMDDGSLWAKMKIDKQVQEARETHALAKSTLEAGRPLEFSIGYFIKNSSEKQIEGIKVRVLEEVQVEEVSLVPWGANSESKVSDVKQKPDSTSAPTNDENVKNTELELAKAKFKVKTKNRRSYETQNYWT